MNPDKAAELCGGMNPQVGGPLSDPPNMIDIAHANGKVSIERYRLWNRVIYAGQDGPTKDSKQWRNELEWFILEIVVDAVAPERWQIERPHFVRDMIRIAMDDVSKSHLCRRCNGQKQVILSESAAQQLNNPSMTGRSVTCINCDGTGFKPISNRYIALTLSIDESSFRESWKTRYNRILEAVRGLDGAAKSALAHRLSA